MKSPTVIFLYPHDFSEGRSGSHKYCAQIVEGIRQLGWRIHLVGFRNFESQWLDMSKILTMVDEVTLYDFSEIAHFRDRSHRNYSRMGQRIRNCIGIVPSYEESLIRSEFVPHLVSSKFLRFIEKLISSNHYQFGFVSYAYWSEVSLLFRKYGTTSIMITHDVLARQPFAQSAEFDQELALVDEIRRVLLFDYTLSISFQEANELRTIESNFEILFLPVTMKQPRFLSIPDLHDRRYDLVFGGHANVHNMDGIHWFLQEVLPCLPSHITFAVFGRICKEIKLQVVPSNVFLLGEIDDLSKLYSQARVAICPLQSGTGMKVKVIEALSFGLPVVTTDWGVSGFPDQNETGCSVANSSKEFTQTLLEVLNNEELYQQKQAAAKKAFETWFSEDTTLRVLGKILPSVT